MDCDIFNPQVESLESYIPQCPFGNGLMGVVGVGMNIWGGG